MILTQVIFVARKTDIANLKRVPLADIHLLRLSKGATCIYAGCKTAVDADSCRAGIQGVGSCGASTCGAGTCGSGICGTGTCGAGICGAGTCGATLVVGALVFLASAVLLLLTTCALFFCYLSH